MIYVVCDACKKPITNAQREKNYWTILDKSLCTPCRDKLEGMVVKKMEGVSSNRYEKYKVVYAEVLKKVCR